MTSRWLRLVRIHTSSLTQPTVLLGLVLAGVNDWRLYPLYALFAVIYHAAGFVHNDIKDDQQDKDDPAKKHFPLVSGEITLQQAKNVYRGLTLLMLMLGVFLSNGKLLAIMFLFLAFGFGWLYNVRSKIDILSPLYIALAFVCLPLFSYFAYCNSLSSAMIWVAVYAFFLMFYQIAVEGYMKDIAADKVSLLYMLGTRINPNGTVKVNVGTKRFAWLLRLPVFILFFVIAHVINTQNAAMILGSIFIFGNTWASYKLLQSGQFDNKKRVCLCALIEVFTYSSWIFALQGILDWTGVAIFILYPYAWFLALNRLTWKTWITPRV